MELSEKLADIANRITNTLDHISTEEATKNALIMPFLQALGYDIFDPTEVIPEFTADHGIKKGEKVDYAVKVNGVPVILIECKHCKSTLSEKEASQLYRYFSVTQARIGILTNGVQYRLYSDLEEANKMDSRPFFEFRMDQLDETIIQELAKLAKTRFDLESFLSAASDLKYTRQIKKRLRDQLQSPSDEFIRFLLADGIYAGRLTQNALTYFKGIAGRALAEFIKEVLTERFRTAMGDEAPNLPTTTPTSEEGTPPEAEEPTLEQEDPKRNIETTEQEIEGFHIVKALLRKNLEPSRVVMRDTQTYCGILLDNNNRKPICRLYFNNPRRMYIALFDREKKETRHPVTDLNDIYKHTEHLRETITYYDGNAE